MMKRRIGLLIWLLCLCLSLAPCHAQAASTSDAVEPIRPERSCTLTVSYCYGETAFADLQVRLYRIAEVSADFQYSLTPAFASSGLILNGIQSAGEWDVVRATLEAHILADAIAPDATTLTDQNGQAHFENLKTGMYLAVVDRIVQGDLYCEFASALVALPGLDPDGRWLYDVEVYAKPGILPPIEPDEEKEWKVLKLWKGDENSTQRPKSVEIEIFRNGVSCETVILSEENHWCYSWQAKDDGAQWTVIERNVPEGYTMTVEVREASFIVTNTLDTNEPPPNPPETGDTANILVYILLMAASGSLLMILGITGKRNSL